MKTQIILLSLLSIFLGNSENKNVQIYKADHIIDHFKVKEKYVKDISVQFENIAIGIDTLKKSIPYKVLYSNEALRYSIRKVGTDKNEVFFSKSKGFSKLSNLTFYQSNGTLSKIGNKKGFENVRFPFKCKISALKNYSERTITIRTSSNTHYENIRSNKERSLINDFEIEIYDSGSWEISFN